MNLINDRIYKYLSIRQLIFNVFLASSSAEIDFNNPAFDVFTEVEQSLFDLIVRNGMKKSDVVAAFRYDSEIPIMRDEDGAGAWKNEVIKTNYVTSSAFREFFSWDNYGFGYPQYVRLYCHVLIDGRTETWDVLVQNQYVDFFIA